MPSKLDPHHLVALMCYKFSGTQDSSARRLDPSFHTSEHGTSNRHVTNVRTFRILDALASISVSREKSEAYAVALQLDVEKKEICLTVAGNHSVPEALIKHLDQVWRRLRVLSSKYADQRARASESFNYQLASPEIPAQVAPALKLQIFKDIYEYSLKKQIKQIKKWLDKLGKFIKALLMRRGPSNLDDFEESIFNIAIALSIVLELVSKLEDDPETPLTDTEWETVYRQSMKANVDVRALLADRDEIGLEILAQEFRGMPLLPPVT